MFTIGLEDRPIIMVVDDDPVILNSLVSALKKDYSIRPFTSGRIALDFLAHEHADLIILDYQMPEMTGIEVLKALQFTPKTREIPVVFLTGSIDSESEIEALELGAADYIAKPVRPRPLLTRVRIQLELKAHRQQLEALVEERTKKLNIAYSKLKAREEVTLSLLAKATDLRDHDTGGHIERTTEFVRIIVEDLLNNPRPGYDFTKLEADDIIRSSKLHDLGKIAMPDYILLKQGRLSADEFDIVKKHPSDGERFLSDFVVTTDDSFLETARSIAFTHHEKWDGTGYPLGLVGDNIPLPGRIVAIADVYDALTSTRPYKKPIPHDESMKIIIENSGSQFDPYIVEVVCRHAEEFRAIREGIGTNDNQEKELGSA